MEQDQLSTTVTNYLFKIAEDPYEYNNLAGEYPEVVDDMSRAIWMLAPYIRSVERARFDTAAGLATPKGLGELSEITG